MRIIHQPPGPAHWSLPSNHSLRTDFVISASCLKKLILREIEELCPSSQIKEQNQGMYLTFCLKIYAISTLPNSNLACMLNTNFSTRYFCSCYMRAWKKFTTVSRLHRRAWRAKPWLHRTVSPYPWTLEDNPHLEDHVLQKLVHTQQFLGGPFTFLVLVRGTEAWTQGLMHGEQML